MSACDVRGSCEKFRCDDILVVKWTDKREVCMLTTKHKGDMKDSNKVDYVTHQKIKKPDCVLAYTENMSPGVYEEAYQMVQKTILSHDRYNCPQCLHVHDKHRKKEDSVEIQLRPSVLAARLVWVSLSLQTWTSLTCWRPRQTSS